MILAAALGSALLAGCSSAPKETTAAATTAETTAEEKKEESKAEETKAEEKKEEAAGNDMLSNLLGLRHPACVNGCSGASYGSSKHICQLF